MLRSSKRPLSADLLLLAVLVLLFAYDQAQADPFDFDLEAGTPERKSVQPSAYFETRNQYFTSTDEWRSTRLQAHVELKWGEYAPRESAHWRGFVSAGVEHDRQTSDYRDPTRAELKEAYLLRDGDTTDITIGKQRVAWGTADGVSTIDRINAVDLRDPIGNARTASRRPSWLVRLERRFAGGTLDLVWLPRGRDVKLPEFGSPWEPAGLHALRAQRARGELQFEIEDSHRPEGGVRYQVYGQGIDWSLGVYNGYTDGPVKLRQRGDLLQLSAQRIRTANVAAAVGLAQSTLRAEVAYTPDAWIEGVPSDLWQVVLGWDRTFFTSLYINLQVYHDAAADAQDRSGITFAITQQAFDDAATVGLRGQVANDAQHALEAFIDYRFGDHLTVSGKLLSFDGADESPLGAFQDNDFAALTLRWDV